HWLGFLSRRNVRRRRSISWRDVSPESAIPERGADWRSDLQALLRFIDSGRGNRCLVWDADVGLEPTNDLAEDGDLFRARLGRPDRPGPAGIQPFYLFYFLARLNMRPSTEYRLLRRPTTQAPLPKYSLPRYADPTPSAAHRKLPREEEADLALKNTKFAPGTRQTLIALFLLTIVAVPLVQLIGEFRAAGSISRLPMISIFKSLPWLPHSEDLKRVERTLENESLVSQWLLPRVQYLLTVVLGAGNEQVYLGHDPWLFYRADVDHVIGPPFLDPLRLKHRLQGSRVQPDPIKAIVDFRNQLTARGIDLVVLPVSVKPSVEGEMLAVSNANRAQASGALPNPSFNEFKARLEREKVRVF